MRLIQYMHNKNIVFYSIAFYAVLNITWRMGKVTAAHVVFCTWAYLLWAFKNTILITIKTWNNNTFFFFFFEVSQCFRLCCICLIWVIIRTETTDRPFRCFLLSFAGESKPYKFRRVFVLGWTFKWCSSWNILRLHAVVSHLGQWSRPNWRLNKNKTKKYKYRVCYTLCMRELSNTNILFRFNNNSFWSTVWKQKDKFIKNKENQKHKLCVNLWEIVRHWSHIHSSDIIPL